MKPIIFISLFLCVAGFSAEIKKMAVINFQKCVELSKEGKQEREHLESLKHKLGESLERTEKELSDLSVKLQDADYMETLSEEGQGKLRQQYDLLQQDLAQYQNQYYQIMQQANMRVMQTLHQSVCHAAEKIRQERKLDAILTEDSLFAVAEELNCTQEIIRLMDEAFDAQHKE